MDIKLDTHPYYLESITFLSNIITLISLDRRSKLIAQVSVGTNVDPAIDTQALDIIRR